MKQLLDACRANEVTDIVIVHEHRGDPGDFGLLEICQLHQLQPSLIVTL